MSAGAEAAAPALRVISRAEVAEHNSRESCWIIVDGLVLDVTAFLSEHPGGGDLLLERAGLDASVNFHEVAHSTGAKRKMQSMVIGQLPEAERTKASKSDACSVA